MALPRQVRDKIEEVEKLEKQLKGEPEVVEVEEPTEEPKEPEVPEAEPKAEDEPKSEPKAEPEEPKKPEDDVNYWKQKYRTLQGMYDKEVPDLRSKVKDLTDKVADLVAVKAEASKQNNLVTDEDVQNFGEDLIEVQRKVAREVAAEFQAELDKLRTDNQELRKLLGSTDGKVERSSFESRLMRLVPDFPEIDNDPNWVAWLDQVDPVLRAPRRIVAEQAYQAGDAEGVAYYVNMFKQTLVKAEPTEPAKPDPKKGELERQIQPSRSAASSTPTSAKQKTYSTSEIQGMFKRIVSLNNIGRFDEANKLEAEIDAAYSQGRVSA